MKTTKTAVAAVNATTVQTFRLVGRGYNKAGVYKRHVFNVRGTYSQAWEAMKARYDDVTKGFEPESVFINVIEGLHSENKQVVAAKRAAAEVTEAAQAAA